MTNVQLLESDNAIWKTKDGEVAIATMSDEYLQKVESTVKKRLRMYKHSIQTNEELMSSIQQELAFRKDAKLKAIEDIDQVNEGQRFVLNDELVVVDNLEACKEQLVSAIDEGTLFGYYKS